MWNVDPCKMCSFCFAEIISLWWWGRWVMNMMMREPLHIKRQKTANTVQLATDKLRINLCEKSMFRARLHLFFIHHLHVSPTHQQTMQVNCWDGWVQKLEFFLFTRRSWKMKFRCVNLPMGNAGHSHFPCPTHYTGIQFHLHRRFFRQIKFEFIENASTQ